MQPTDLASVLLAVLASVALLSCGFAAGTMMDKYSVGRAAALMQISTVFTYMMGMLGLMTAVDSKGLNHHDKRVLLVVFAARAATLIFDLSVALRRDMRVQTKTTYAEMVLALVCFTQAVSLTLWMASFFASPSSKLLTALVIASIGFTLIGMVFASRGCYNYCTWNTREQKSTTTTSK